jgi:hypothetical protein
MVEKLVPLAVTEVGLAMTVDCEELTEPATKFTEAVSVSTNESVESVAENVDNPADKEETVNVTIPNTLDDPEGVEIVSRTPRLEVRATVFPETGFP